MPLCVTSLINATATARFTDCKETCLVREQQKLFVRDGENDLFCCFLVSLFWQPIYKQEERSLILLQKEFSKVNILYMVYINRSIRAIVQNNTRKRADSFLLIYNIVADPVHAILKDKIMS